RTKKPVPRACPAVIEATAGSTRPTTSSSDEGGGGVVSSGAGGGVVNSEAPAVVCSGGAGSLVCVAPARFEDDDCDAERSTVCCADGSPDRMNITASPPPITSPPTSIRTPPRDRGALDGVSSFP